MVKHLNETKKSTCSPFCHLCLQSSKTVNNLLPLSALFVNPLNCLQSDSLLCDIEQSLVSSSNEITLCLNISLPLHSRPLSSNRLTVLYSLLSAPSVIFWPTTTSLFLSFYLLPCTVPPNAPVDVQRRGWLIQSRETCSIAPQWPFEPVSALPLSTITHSLSPVYPHFMSSLWAFSDQQL